MTKRAPGAASRLVKRALDLAAAGLGMLLLAPFLAAVAALIRLRIGSPVLFRQRRTGLAGRPFTLFKFRTMRAQDEGEAESLSDAQRLTRLGIGLRTLSVDELPQLWNVVRGDMSLVGPRPLMDRDLRDADERLHRVRHSVRPGITGWAQINGRNAISFRRKFELDAWYVENWSLGLDLRILLATIGKVLGREHIWKRGQLEAAGVVAEEDPSAG